MSILIIMIPLSLLLVVGAGVAFFWAVDHDQFDDMQTPALLPLMDESAGAIPVVADEQAPHA
jgi:cbb3-type cytochrome oxidase maturation protein